MFVAGTVAVGLGGFFGFGFLEEAVGGFAEDDDEFFDGGEFFVGDGGFAVEDGEGFAEFGEGDFEVEFFAGFGFAVEVGGFHGAEEDVLGVEGFAEFFFGFGEYPEAGGLSHGFEDDGGGEDGVVFEVAFEEVFVAFDLVVGADDVAVNFRGVEEKEGGLVRERHGDFFAGEAFGFACGG